MKNDGRSSMSMLTRRRIIFSSLPYFMTLAALLNRGAAFSAAFTLAVRVVDPNALDSFSCNSLMAHRSIRFRALEWRQMGGGGGGYLSGIYVEAFEAFLKLLNLERPDLSSDPIVGLFLLICDLAINPTRGLPLDIGTSFEDFTART